MKGSDRIVDPLLTKGLGSDRRSEKKGSCKSLVSGLSQVLKSFKDLSQARVYQKIFGFGLVMV